MGELLLGIDVGTQVTKGVLVHPSGRVLAQASREYEVSHPHPLWAEQWPDVWLEAVKAVIRELVDGLGADAVAGVCISGLYGGSGIPLDKRMRPVRPCLIWMDRRATDEVRWVMENVDMERLFAITGNWVDSYYGYTKILWIKRNEPANWRKIHLFLPPNAYVVYRLTGEVAMDHSSAGNLGGLYDIRRRTWSDEAADLLGIPLDLLPPRIVSSSEVVGEVTEKGAKLSGLRRGTPVLAGGIDAPMETLAAGAFSRGDNVAMMGTSTCWGIIHRGEGFARELVSMPHVIEPERLFYTWAGSATSGALARWFRDQLGHEEVRVADERGRDPYEILDEEAAKISPGCEGLVALPYFMGERAPLWDPEARGAFVGLTLSHTRAHLFRSLLEAAAFSLRQAIETGVKIGLHISEETVVVGGVAQSKLWLQIIADVTGRPIRALRGGVGAPLADALLVGLATGLVEDPQTVRAWISLTDPILPDPERQEIYERYYGVYRRLYSALAPEFHRLTRLSQANTR